MPSHLFKYNTNIFKFIPCTKQELCHYILYKTTKMKCHLYTCNNKLENNRII